MASILRCIGAALCLPGLQWGVRAQLKNRQLTGLHPGCTLQTGCAKHSCSAACCPNCHPLP